MAVAVYAPVDDTTCVSIISRSFVAGTTERSVYPLPAVNVTLFVFCPAPSSSTFATVVLTVPPVNVVLDASAPEHPSSTDDVAAPLTSIMVNLTVAAAPEIAQVTVFAPPAVFIA